MGKIQNKIIGITVIILGLYVFWFSFPLYWLFLPLLSPLILILSIIWANLPVRFYKKIIFRIVGYSFPILIFLSIISSIRVVFLYNGGEDVGGQGWFFLIGWGGLISGVVSGLLSLLFFRHIIRKSREWENSVKK